MSARLGSHRCAAYGCRKMVAADATHCPAHLQEPKPGRIRIHGDGTLEVWVTLPTPAWEIKRVQVLETERAGCAWYYPEGAQR